MFALTVDIYEQRTDLRQDRNRRRSTVQPRATAPPRVDLSTENEQAVTFVYLELLEHPGQRITVWHAVQVKCRIDRGRRGSRANHVRANTITEDRAQRVDQNRLTGAGFPGQDIQTGTEGNLNGL